MSSQRTLIFGENWEEQLKPFEEYTFPSTAVGYVQEVDTTAEHIKTYEEHLQYCKDNPDCECKATSFFEYMSDSDFKIPDSETERDLFRKHRIDYLFGDFSGYFQVFEFKNPNGYWDSYEIADSHLPFMLNTGEMSAQAYMKDIDWLGTVRNNNQKATDLYRNIKQATGNGVWTSRQELEKQNPDADWGEITNLYWAQPALQDIRRKSRPFEYTDWQLDACLKSEEEYVELKSISQLFIDAYILDGQWYSFRNSVTDYWNEYDNITYADRYNWHVDVVWNLIQKQDPETLLTLVRCHE